MNHILKKRAVILFWALSLIFAGLLGHLAYIQIIAGPQLSRQALSQQSQAVALEIPPRGLILDRNLKNLTPFREVWRIIIFPAAVTDRQRTVRVLSLVLRLDPEKVNTYLGGNARIVPMDLDSGQIMEMKKNSLPGVILSRINLRERKPPQGAHILGYVGIGSSLNDWEGKMGLESFYDKELRGQEPRSAVRIFLDARGQVIRGLGYRYEDSSSDAARKNVVTTIDSDIQGIVEKVMAGSGVREGAVVVMDIENSDILAMASTPGFYLQEAPETPLNQEDGTGETIQSGEAIQRLESYLNNSLAFRYPGSVFKVIVAAAALEEGITSPDNVYLCIGEKDDLVRCYEKDGHGLLTFSQALAYSCNPVFARIGMELGAQKLISYATRFGIDNGSIIGYHSTNRKEQLERIGEKYNLVNASLGQWPVKANVVQVTAMMAAVANDGLYTQPRLVSKILNDDGTVSRTLKNGRSVRAVSSDTAAIIRTMLEMTTMYGTGRQAMVEPWGSAGKTGSAQTGAGKTDAWFSGYVPLSKPRYAITVLVTGGESGGGTAAPVFREIAEGIMEMER